MFHKIERACVEVSNDIYPIAVKEWSPKKVKHLYVYLFDNLVNKLPRRFCIEKDQWYNALDYFLQDLLLIIYYYITPS